MKLKSLTRCPGIQAVTCKLQMDQRRKRSNREEHFLEEDKRRWQGKAKQCTSPARDPR